MGADRDRPGLVGRFMNDSFVDGRQLRALNVLDLDNREGLVG